MPDTRTAPGAQQFIPPDADDLAALKTAAAGCRGCELYEPATQTVFGRGDAHARAVFVGEQPGDMEDRKGLPFVGPAGHLLREAVDEAGIDPKHIYLTNAVKHFRFELRGKRRIHQLGPSFRVTPARGRLMPWPDAAQHPDDFRQVPVDSRGDRADAPPAQLLATIHPSAVLRADNRDEAYAGLVADLRIAAGVLTGR